MDISGMIRGLTGGLRASEAKSLELKPGQIVRGVVQQLIPENEAIVNIAGTQVRAKLEVPMAEGQAAMLQVQAQASEGKIVFKPVPNGMSLPESSLSELLKSFDLEDSVQNREIAKQLQQAGLPLTKDNIKQLSDIVGKLPAGMNKEQMLASSVIAMTRGLPITTETTAAIRQAVFGQSMNESMADLMNAVDRSLSTASNKMSPETRQLLELLRAAIQQVKQAAGSLPPPPQGIAAGAGTPPPPQGIAAGAGTPPPAQGMAAGAGAPPPAQGIAAGAGTPPPAQGMAAGAGAPPPAQGIAAGAGAPPPAQGMAAGAGAPPPAQGIAAGAGTPLPAQDDGGHWIGRMLKALGIEHEKQLLPLLTRSADANGAMQQPTDAIAQRSDSLKSILLQLSSNQDVPTALKEAVQQSLQTITGQQLLLASDRSAMLSHITLFVPLANANGEQTASIHIQSRMQQNGALDAKNCRLIFDLDMQTLGLTLIDVQVVDRIVSLQINNDFPLLQELLDAHKEEITQGLSSLGYQFISLKYGSYPHKATDTAESGAPFHSKDAHASLHQTYIMPAYKGVDVRI